MYKILFSFAFLCMFSFNGISEGSWDYKSLPKRMTFDLAQPVNGAKHITDLYSPELKLKKNKTLKSVKKYWDRSYADSCDRAIKFNEECYYDELGRLTRKIERECDDIMPAFLPEFFLKECETKYSYEITDSFYIVTTMGNFCKNNPYMTLETNRFYYDRSTGYLIKQVESYAKEGSESYQYNYFYNNQYQLERMSRVGSIRKDIIIGFKVKYNCMVLEGDTLIFNAYHLANNHPDTDTIVPSYLLRTTRFIFYKEKLLTMCFYNSEAFAISFDDENTLCEKGCKEIYQGRRLRKKYLKRRYLIEYY